MLEKSLPSRAAISRNEQDQSAKLRIGQNLHGLPQSHIPLLAQEDLLRCLTVGKGFTLVIHGIHMKFAMVALPSVGVTCDTLILPEKLGNLLGDLHHDGLTIRSVIVLNKHFPGLSA